MAAKKQNWETRPTRPGVEASKRPEVPEAVSSGVRRNVQDGLRAVGIEDSLPLDGMRVVWVDADRDAAAHGRSVLEAWGAVVVYADGAASGLDTTVRAKPDCVVISLTQGVRVARTLYYMIPDAPPVVLITEYTRSGDDACPGVSSILRMHFQGRDMLHAMLRIQRR